MIKNINMKVTRKIATINTNLFNTIYTYLEMTMPLHKLKKSHIKLLTVILYQYHTSDETDEMDKWANIFTYENKVEIREKLGDISEANLNNQLSELRAKGAISKKVNRVTPAFNPAIQKDSETFEVIVRFNFKHGEK